MSVRLMHLVAVLVVLLVFSCQPEPVTAQVVGGTIQGAITDSSGATMPGAKVGVTNTATDVTRTVTANQDGRYRVPNLIPGQYQVTASAPGFATVVQNGLILTVGAELEIDLQLRVGALNEKIEITGEQPDVSTTTSTISHVVDGSEVRELPLNGRDWAALATLEPGVAPVRTQIGLSTGANDRTIRGIGSQLAVGANPSNLLGNGGRNNLTGPGLSNFDLSLFKNNRIPKISEQFRVQFRVELFNVLNHTNFAPPLKNNNQNSACCVIMDQTGNLISTAGKLDSTSTSSRQIQFGLKLT